MLTDRIYYVDKVINAIIYEDFEVVENSGFINSFSINWIRHSGDLIIMINTKNDS